MDIKINFADAEIIGKRDEQQDYKANLIVKGGYVLYVLADGMGGQIGGATASREVVTGFLDFFNEQGVGENPELSLRAALDQGNNRLIDILRVKPEMNGMGTTIIAMLYHQATNRYWFLSVGDSPLYMQTPKGILRLNENHAYYEDLLKKVQKGLISQTQADEHPSRHAITSAVMGKKISLIDTGSGQLNKNELILLASDGVQTLTDLAGGELEQILMAKKTLSETVTQIIQKITEKNSPHQDNVTLILVEPVFNEQPHTIVDLAPSSKEPNMEKEVIKKSGKKRGGKNRLLFFIIAIVFSFVLGGSLVFYVFSTQSNTDVVTENIKGDTPKVIGQNPALTTTAPVVNDTPDVPPIADSSPESVPNLMPPKERGSDGQEE